MDYLGYLIIGLIALVVVFIAIGIATGKMQLFTDFIKNLLRFGR